MDEKVNREDATITFKGKEYLVTSLNDESNRAIEHLIEIDKRLREVTLAHEQYQVTHAYYMDVLEKALEPDSEIE
jgi:hypothetical protein